MPKKKKKTKNVFLIIVILFMLIFSIFFLSKLVYEYRERKRQEEIAEQIRIEKEKEAQRINDMAISSTIYLAINEPYQIDCEILSGNLYKSGTSIYSDVIGDSIIYCKSEDKKYKVTVSDLFSIAHIDNYKNNIPIDAYDENEEAFLDDVLKTRIENVGYKTRAAVVEAARFLSMNFDYKIPYFCENGRLTGGDSYYADGEGRFYHQGLYLTSAKYNVLDPNGIVNGPLPWGGLMHHSCGVLLKPNGLDCSGFVSWCLVQAGFDPGDYGAGSNYEGDAFCLPDLGHGDAGAIWLDDIDPNKIQAGDIIAWQGTVALVVGVDEENIYTAHQYWDNGLEVVTDTKISLKDYPYGEDCGDWQYVTLMDDYYKENGNGQGKYTAMWPKAAN